jgi:hypothetical protein
MKPEDPHDSVLFIAVIIGVIVGLLASLFIVTVYLCYKDLQTITFRLIFYMSVADFLNGVTYLLPSEGTSCYVQAVGNTLFPLSSVLWASVIAYCLHRVVVKQDTQLLRYEKHYLVYAYGLPLLFLIPPAATGTFGPAQGWCWIKAEGDDYVIGSVLRLLCFYLPLWAVIGYNLYIYAIIIRKLNRDLETVTDDDGEVLTALVRRLVFYPIILIVCYSVVTAKRIYDFAYPDQTDLTFTIAAWIFQCAIGLLNAVTYGSSDAVRQRLCMSCRKPDRSYSNFSEDDVDIAQRRGYS